MSAMTDVTLTMNRYREATRGLWNCYLREETETPTHNSGTTYDFAALSNLLFAALVLRELGLDDHIPEFTGSEYLSFSRHAPINFLKVVPSSAKVPIMINRGVPRTPYWDDPINVIDSTADLRFIDYFDWDSDGYRDFAYYNVRIVRFVGHPELIGRDALLEWHYGRVYLESSNRA